MERRIKENVNSRNCYHTTFPFPLEHIPIKKLSRYRILPRPNWQEDEALCLFRVCGAPLPRSGVWTTSKSRKLKSTSVYVFVFVKCYMRKGKVLVIFNIVTSIFLFDNFSVKWLDQFHVHHRPLWPAAIRVPLIVVPLLLVVQVLAWLAEPVLHSMHLVKCKDDCLKKNHSPIYNIRLPMGFSK